MNTPWLVRKYNKSEKVRHFPLTVEGSQFIILINPDAGSWAALTQEEFNRYENNNLPTLLGEALFLRMLAVNQDNEEVDLNFPKPADFPSVVVVNITTNCNLYCKYCFAGCGPWKGEEMGEEVMLATIQQMLSMPKTQVVTFEFQGGEPLLNWQGIEKFVELAEIEKTKYTKKVQYRVESNGLPITDEIICFLKKYNIEIGISMDGPAPLTNQSRVFYDGTGAFYEIWQGVEKLKKAGIEIAGSVCTIGKHNVNKPKEIVDFFADNGIAFKPRPANILGRELEQNMVPNAGEWFNCFKDMYIYSKERKITNFSIHIFEENVYTPIRDYICMRFPCGAGREIVSVNPNGDVFPCDGFKGEVAFKIGNVLEETILEMLQKEDVKILRQRTYKDIPKCSNCLFRGMCCSCCYSAYGAFGTVYREDPQCIDRQRIYIYLMKEWIRNNMLCPKS